MAKVIAPSTWFTESLEARKHVRYPDDGIQLHQAGNLFSVIETIRGVTRVSINGVVLPPMLIPTIPPMLPLQTCEPPPRVVVFRPAIDRQQIARAA